MKQNRPTVLGHALLGLLEQCPMSGYAVRKIFATTPMGHYSDSPGSIYPALERLQRAGFVAGTVVPAERGPARRVYRITERGLSSLRKWLRQPVTDDDVSRGAGELTLRFGFMEPLIGMADTIRFLEGYHDRLKAHVARLNEYEAMHGRTTSLSARHAMRAGILDYRCRLLWAGEALRAYRRVARGKPRNRRS
jgi:DNA-binding PadR family transcriptional regulator